MLYLFCLLIMMIPVFLGFGSIFQWIFGQWFTGLASKLITGVFSAAVLFTLLAFFFPLSIYLEIGALAVGLTAFFWFKSYRELWVFLAESEVWFFLIAAVTVFFASYYPFILDHFGYYVPTVKWISEVGLVRGISNLDLILGQMSVWHGLQAGFSNFSDPFLRINTVVMLTWLIYIFERKGWIHLFFFPVLYLFLQSPSPDLPAIALSLIILNEILQRNTNPGIIFTLSVFVFAVKPTMIWLPVFVLLHQIFMLRSNLRVLLPGMVLLFLFLFKGIWTFGYPVFPVQVFDFNVPWKPNPELLRNSSQMALQKTYDMQFTPAEIAQFSTFDRIKNWLFLDGIKGRIHLFFILSLFAFFVYAFMQKSRTVWLLFSAILFKSILVLLFSAQYRFFLDVFFVVFFVLLYQKWTRQNSLLGFSVSALVLGVLLSFPNVLKTIFPSFRLGDFMTGFSNSQFYKPAYFELRKFKTYKVGNLTFNVVQDYPFSFDTPLPAISPQFIQEDLDAGIFPQLKGKTLKDGFVWRPLTDSEKMQLQKILDDWAAGNHD